MDTTVWVFKIVQICGKEYVPASYVLAHVSSKDSVDMVHMCRIVFKLVADCLRGK